MNARPTAGLTTVENVVAADVLVGGVRMHWISEPLRRCFVGERIESDRSRKIVTGLERK